VSSRTASQLDSGLIARKGEAKPAGPPSPPIAADPVRATRGAFAPETARPQTEAALPADDTPRPVRGLHGTIAVTVRLDPRRYERLKVYGARLRRTNQEILVEALDRYFRDIKE